MSRELIWPPALRITNIERRLIGNAGVSRSPLSGVTTTVDRSGDRWAISVTVENMSDRASYAERANAGAFLAAIRNRNARVWLHDPAHVMRGSFPASELFTNADFASGTASWGSQRASLSARDGKLRVTAVRDAVNNSAAYQSIAVAAYTPYVLRGFLGARSKSSVSSGIYFGNSQYSTDPQGMLTLARVPDSTPQLVYPVVYSADGAGIVNGDWMECDFASFSRCGLIDNAPNLLLYSEQLDNAAWTKDRATITANATAAPDGTATADSIVEDSTSANSHRIRQAATVPTSVGEYTYSMALKAGARTWAYLFLSGSSGSCGAWVNLSTGALGAVGNGTGWTNTRAAVTALGNGWYRLAVTATKGDGITSVSGYAGLTTSDNVQNYNGDGTSNIYAWGGSLAGSSAPISYARTTTAATVGTSQQGSRIRIKGLPASTSGLLLAGDAVQIGKQFFKVQAPLDSDAAGLGYLEVSPNIRTPFADNDPVIINQPMGRYMLASDDAGYSTRAGRISTMTLEFEEALD